ncbi:MAG: hypothetical protein COB30_002425 [Ectothiorhodospiraceae bacterium]|nr:hypothetical protein [Ectothiorhodospiraceae bacterium]
MNTSHSEHRRTLPAFGLLLLIIAIVLLAINKQDAAPPENWVEGWQPLLPFTHPRRALAATAVGDYLYVLGGVDDQGRYVLPVEYARILDDGQLGPWKQTSPLLKGRFYLASASQGDYLYALGGGGGDLGDNNVPLASVERAKINPNGSLQSWEHHSYLSTPRRGLKASVVDERLYAIGGYNGQFLKSTEHLKPDNASASTEWHLDSELSQTDRYIHAAATMDKRLFLIGGHVEKGGPMSYGDVESAAIETDGNLGPWKIAQTRLLNPRFIASAFSVNQRLYIVGGHDGIRRLATVEMAKADSNGRVGPWTSLKNMHHKRSATAIAITNYTIYVVGGMDDNGVLRSVEMSQPLPNGKLGYIEKASSPIKTP